MRSNGLITTMTNKELDEFFRRIAEDGDLGRALARQLKEMKHSFKEYDEKNMARLLKYVVQDHIAFLQSIVHNLGE